MKRLTRLCWEYFLAEPHAWSVFLSDAGNSDRVVIQELIKTVAQSQQIQSNAQREFKGSAFFFRWVMMNQNVK